MVYEYTSKDGVIRVNWSGSIYGPSIEDYEETMAKVIDILIENKRAESIILAETREYEYGYEQTQMLLEVANAVRRIIREKKLISKAAVDLGKCEKYVMDDFSKFQDIMLNKLRGDPIGAYVEVKRMSRYSKIKLERGYQKAAGCHRDFIDKILKPAMDILEETKLIQKAQPLLSGYHVGERDIYREIFHPTVRPNFMRTKYMSQSPAEGKIIDRYDLPGGIKIEVYKVPEKLRYVYHVSPPEFRLSEDKYTILDAARRYMKEHRPRSSEFSEPERMREVFFNIGKDMVMDIADHMGVSLSSKEADDLANILTRYTAGLGILELLLADKEIQDIYVNSPVGKKPVYIFHGRYQECETNLIPTNEDAQSWATRFRLISGRPLDEANPVLDTETSVPGGRARIAVITRTLSPEGLGFSIRRHRDKPWTYPLFINNNFFNPLFAGLMSFILDGARTMLIAGTRSSGKTSLLGASMLELMRKIRMVTCEDSVAGDSRILIRRNGKFEKTTVGDLVDDLIEKNGTQQKFGREIVDSSKVKDKIEIPSFDEKGGYKFKQVSSFIRHRTDKDIYEVETSTGRKLKVTGDHSLFGIGDKSVLKEVKVKDMKPGGFVAVPRKHKIKNEPKQLNLMEHLDKFEEFYIEGEEIKGVIEKNWERIKKLKDRFGYSKKMHSYWKNNSILPVKIFRYLDCELGSSKPAVQIKPKNGGSPLPVKIPLDEDFLTLIGLWIADGCYDKKHVLFSVAEEELRDVVKKAGKRIGIETTHHSDGFTLLMNSKVFKTLMKDVLELKGDAYTKRIPGWVYNLSETQISHVLKGIFSGDGCIGEKEILIPLASDELLHDIQTLLLNFDIILRRANHRREDGTFNASITALKFQQRFMERIGILTKNKRSKLYELCSKTSTHDNSDIIPISLGVKTELNEIYPEFNKHDYITRKNNIGREKLKQMVPEKGNELNPLGFLAESDILWDKITKVKKLKPEKYVYDFSVPGNENFVCENILAHNTLELPVERLRELGFNIERLKSRSVITRVETELPAEEAIRTALRLGDSSLILGEVRSNEAKALYEAMRIGALANTVAGTIHGDSPYGVFDRVVNDLGVPPTSFKATDIIVIANMLRSASGLSSFRRVTGITEVRKHWREDPSEEGGFINLMEYSSKEDKLKPTDTLLNGESYILNEVARNVPQWRGNWAAVWENIKLRGDIKKAITDYANKMNKPELMEAPFIVKSNNQFHNISEELRQEVGAIPRDRAYRMWLDWLKKQIKK